MVRARLLVLLACLGWFASGCADAQHPGEESASSDDVPRHTSHRHKKKHKKQVAQDPNGDDDSAPKKHKKPTGDDDDDAPKKPKKHAGDDDDDAPKKSAKKVAAKNHAGDDDDDAPKKAAKKSKKSDDDDDDDDSAAKKKAAAKKAAAEKAEEKAEKKAEKKAAAKEAAEEKAAAKKAADEKAAEEKAAAKKAAEDKAAEEKAAKKRAAEDDTPKVSDDDDEDEDKPVAKPKVATKGKPKAKSEGDDDDKPAAKPKPVAVKAKNKAKSDDDEDEPAAKRKSEPIHEDTPAPPKKQRSIEEDVAIDDPLATKPPVRTASSDEEEEAEDTTTTAGAVAVAAAPSRNSPLQDRSLTTPTGQLDLHAGLPIGVLSVTNATGMATSSTSTGLALGVAYGVNAKAEIGFNYTLGISPGAVKGPITLHGAYSLQRGKLDFAGAAALAIDFTDTVNPMTMTTTTDTAASLQLGAWVRYHATPTVTLFTGLPATPNATASLTRLAFPLPVLAYQVQIGLRGNGIIALTVPAGIGYQASPKLYTFASLDLANIRIANTSNAFLFKDFIPIALGGFYQFDTLSVGATFADDLKQGFGYLRFELIARYLLH